MTPTYTLLPPGPIDPTLKFDRHQFVKRSRAISIESHIAFSDFHHMHTERHVGQRRLCEFGPVFANNEKQLRHVLAETAWKACIGSKAPLPAAMINNLPELIRLTEAKTAKIQSGQTFKGTARRILNRYLWNHEQAGGYLHFRARLIYLSWHMGYTSVEVAQVLGTTPQNVRVILYRLCRTAQALGYETFQHREGTRVVPLRVHRPTSKLPPGPQLIEIYEVFGVTFAELGERFGVHYGTARYAYQKAKKLADPKYQPRKGPRRWVKIERVGNKIIGRSTRGPKEKGRPVKASAR